MINKRKYIVLRMENIEFNVIFVINLQKIDIITIIRNHNFFFIFSMKDFDYITQRGIIQNHTTKCVLSSNFDSFVNCKDKKNEYEKTFLKNFFLSIPSVVLLLTLIDLFMWRNL